MKRETTPRLVALVAWGCVAAAAMLVAPSLPDGAADAASWQATAPAVTRTATASAIASAPASDTPQPTAATTMATPTPTVTMIAEHTATATAAATATATATPGSRWLPYLSHGHVIYTATPTYTPTITPTPTVTPVPWMSMVYVGNHTGSEMCYEVFGTGIGRKCFPSGEHLYGTFAAGGYLFMVELRCGSAQLPWHYDGGRFVHDFWCP